MPKPSFAQSVRDALKRPENGAQGQERAFSQALAALSPKRGGSAVRTTIDGITFQSGREAERYSELKMMEKAGRIRDLQAKSDACKFPIVINGVKICDYHADYTYMEAGVRVVEDSKSGFVTQIFRLKKKMMKACYGIDIRETR